MAAQLLPYYERFMASPWLQLLLWTGISVILWKFSSKAPHDLLVYGALIYAILHAQHSWHAWAQPAGWAFIVVGAYGLLSLPLSCHPLMSCRDFGKSFDLLAGLFALSVLFNTRPRVEAALFYSAAAVLLILTFDLGRLAWALGPNLMAKAHVYEPFILNHSNVASMMAGLAALMFFRQAWHWRHRLWPALACGAAVLVCLIYQVVVASRGPQIAFALTVVSLGLLIPSWRGKAAWFAAVLVLGIGIVYQAHHINPRFMEKQSMSNLSERDKVWTHTWSLVKERPWLGHGYGKRNFEAVYYSSAPPRSKFHYPHPHQFWLKLAFESGALGVMIHLTAWLLLAAGLIRACFRESTFEARLLPGTIGLMLLFIHIYGLGDYPDNVVQQAQFWLIPLALTVCALPITGCQVGEVHGFRRSGSNR